MAQTLGEINDVISKEESSELLANFLRLKISRPDDFNWKEDYVKALEEKYASIY